MAKMATPYHRTSALEVMKLTILVKPSLLIITIYLVNLLNANLRPLGGEGHEIYNLYPPFLSDGTSKIQ